MFNRLLKNRNPLFRISVTQSLVAIACLASLSHFGAETGLHLATASTLFVYCSLGDLHSASPSETQ